MYQNEVITKRKDGRFMGRFCIGHHENGKPKYQCVYGHTYEETEHKLRIAREIEQRYLYEKGITVHQAYTEWLDAVSHRVKESSLANYQNKFDKHILPELGNLLCTELTSGCINAFISKKMEQGLSAGYVRDIFTVLKSMLRYAQEEYDFRLHLNNVVLPKAEKKEVQKIDNTQQKHLTKYLLEHLNPTTLGILLSLFMGLRIGELCGLRWSDIDFDKKVLYVNRTVQRISVRNDEHKTKIVISEPKSRSSKRCIPIPEFLISCLEQLRQNDSFYLLSGSEKLIEPRTMQYRYQKILKAAAMAHTVYHRLRHTFATNCIECGFDVKLVSVLLGHSTVSMTLSRYVHPTMEHGKRLMNQLALLI